MYEEVEPIEEKQCRICLEGEKEDKNDGAENKDVLIHPCKCRGFSRYVHRKCLDDWRVQHHGINFYKCEVCLYEYKISRVWWARVLSNKCVPVIGTFILLPTFGILAGLGSSCLYNAIYYSLMHDVYHTPHRMQIMFHTLLWLGVPGLVKLIKNGFSALSMIQGARHERDIPILNPLLQPLQVYNHHHHYYPRPPTPRPCKRRHSSKDDDINEKEKDGANDKNKEKKDSENKTEEKNKNKEEEKKETPIAPYEGHSTILIMTLVGGTVATFYYTCKWMYEKCQDLTKRCVHYVQNVD